MYKRDSQGLMKHLDFLMLDLICLHISYLAAYVLRHGWSNPYAVSTYRSMAIVISFIEIVIIAFFGTFKNVLKRGYYREFAVTVQHVLLVVFTPLSGMFGLIALPGKCYAIALGLILVPLLAMECSKAFGLTKHHK